MKLLVISNMYPDKNPAFGPFIKQQIESLEDIGVEVIRVVKSKKTLLTYVPFLIKSIYFLLFKSYDLVHAHYGFHSALIPSIIKKRPLVITFHRGDALNEPFRNKVYFKLQRFVVARSDYLIAVSSEIKDALVNILGADPDKISVIPCGVDTNIFFPLDKNKNRKELDISVNSKIILFIGQLTHRKGVDLLQKCANRIPEATFILIGGGTFNSHSANVTAVGSQPNHILPKWISSADIFFLPTRSEGTPVVVLEALASGTPVVVSSVGGIPDLVKDGETGYLVESEDIDMFEKGLRDLLEHPEKCRKMGLQGRKEMVESYDTCKVAAKINNICKVILSKKQ